jgi:hypothetical protein
MRQIFKFSVFSFAMILALALCSNIFAQSSLTDFGSANVIGKHKTQVPLTPVVFLDQAPNTVNGLFADATCALCPTGQQTIADNFAATIINSQTGITELVIWGGYYPEDIPNTTDNFTILLHSDNAGQPGTVIATYTNLQATSRVQTGVILFGTHEYMFTFDFSASPIMVPSTGTYWLELFNNSVESGNFYWETGNLDATHGVLGSAWYTTTPGTAWNLDGATDLSAQINGDDNLVPCPVDPVTNPNPSDGATGVDINLTQISWTNGAGATQIDVWFDGTLVYSGTPVTTWTITPTPLEYNTTYHWRVDGKNDTCTTYGPNWSFTTMQNPNLIEWCDYFADLSNWTAVGPFGQSNWSASNSATAGGTPPELYMYWSPSFTGASTIRSVVIPDFPNNTMVNYDFRFYLDWYTDPSGVVTVGVTYDGGTTVNNFYTVTELSGSFTTPASGTENLQIEVTYNGYSFNINWIAFDDMCLYYIIPVELTSFTAKANAKEVELSWITATETNNQGFEVQRSNGGEFETIAFVNGNGTTTETHAYSYTDKDVNAGSYNYRLKQVDFDGTFEYSNVVQVDVSAPTVFALEQNYPNPFNPSTTINFSLPVDSKVSLKVFDILGQEVASLLNGNFVAGSHAVNFNASSLNSGVYMYRLEATGINGTNFTSVKKMILTK